MIPPIIHFLWIYNGNHLSERHILAIRSAVLNTTCKVVLHTDDHEQEPIPGVEIRFRSFEKDIKGIPFESVQITEGKGNRVAHLSDIYRLDILYEEGGIYSDCDVLWLRNPWEFWNKRIVIGYSNKSYKILTNSVLMSAPGEEALQTYRKWLWRMYPTKKYWAPANPYKLWKDNEEVCMIDKYYFYPISWDRDHEIRYDKIQKSIGVHWFDSQGEVYGEVVDMIRDRLLYH